MEIETHCLGYTLAFVSPYPWADGKRVTDQSQLVIHRFFILHNHYCAAVIGHETCGQEQKIQH